jgi:predicted nuclease with TOPRIM domain
MGDPTIIITAITAILTSLGIKEIWNIIKTRNDYKNQKEKHDEYTKDSLTAKIITELRDKIIELEEKIDSLIQENISLKEKLARMEERFLFSPKKKSNKP